ncbi:MAG: hypothetical protein SVU32_00935 [Candidatus Nanohaloarchaea archaeon]|nr:hypothetical protein [Candidatus Nanohaloarchaea archaeon]
MHILVLSHFVFAALILVCGVAVYRAYQESDEALLRPFYRFLGIWGGLFFLPMALFLYLGARMTSPTLLSLAYVVPHMFAFIAVGFLWKTVASIDFPDLEDAAWLPAVWGVATGIYGTYEMPVVTFAGGRILLAPESTFSLLVRTGMGVAALAIAAASFYAAYRLSGRSQVKVALIGVGAFFTLAVAGYMQNSGQYVLGDIATVVGIASFMVAVFMTGRPQITASSEGMDYATVCERIIQKTEDNIGEVAQTQAEEAGLTIDDDGNVEEASRQDLVELIDQYRSIMGEGALAHAQLALKELYEEDRSVTDLDLPENILPPVLRAEQFASAL